MSGIGPTELILVFVIGLLILGPERLPRVASQLGRWVGRARRTANQLRYQLEREVAMADIKRPPRDDAKPPEAGKDPATGQGSEAGSEPPADTAGGERQQEESGTAADAPSTEVAEVQAKDEPAETDGVTRDQ